MIQERGHSRQNGEYPGRSGYMTRNCETGVLGDKNGKDNLGQIVKVPECH